MKIQSGIVSIPVERDGEEAGQIKFNPSDTAFVNRYYALIEAIEQKEKEFEAQKEQLSGDEADERGIPVNFEKIMQITDELCRFLRVEVDKVFGEGTCQTVFGDYNNPEMFEQFFVEVAPHIQVARSEKVAKHTGNRQQKRAAAKGKKVMK